jgi:hypothetical protein
VFPQVIPEAGGEQVAQIGEQLQAFPAAVAVGVGDFDEVQAGGAGGTWPVAPASVGNSNQPPPNRRGGCRTLAA